MKQAFTAKVGPGIASLILALGCGGDEPQSHAAPASVAQTVHETDLNTITLTEQAVGRLGIETAPVEVRSVERYRAVGGEVVVPFEREITVTAPAAGTVLAPAAGGMPATGAFVRQGQPVLRLMFLPGGSDIARVRESVVVTESRYNLAKLEAERADRLFQTQTITRREWETAKTALASAEAEWRAAQARQAALGGTASAESAEVLPMTFASPRSGVLWHLFVGAGQTVAAGAPLFEVISLDPVWIRVPIYAGDLATIARGKSALVQELGGRVSDVSRGARPIAAPPSADATASSVDLYFELRNPESLLRPGHRVTVSLPLLNSAEGLVVPWSAVLYDINGGTWVYEQLSASMFARRRVELSHRVGEWAVLTRGPEPGARVVTIGAAELFGTEFGTGK